MEWIIAPWRPTGGPNRRVRCDGNERTFNRPVKSRQVKIRCGPDTPWQGNRRGQGGRCRWPARSFGRGAGYRRRLPGSIDHGRRQSYGAVNGGQTTRGRRSGQRLPSGRERLLSIGLIDRAKARQSDHPPSGSPFSRVRSLPIHAIDRVEFDGHCFWGLT